MIVLQIDFQVQPGQVDDFIRMYHDSYAVALSRQTGYRGSRLLRLYDREDLEAIEAQTTSFNLQLELTFDTEANRRRWAQSAEHARVWPMAAALCDNVVWRGYSVAATHTMGEVGG